VSGVFLSAIVLPIVGNACEHASAIVFAGRNKVDLALAIAVGSSTQVRPLEPAQL
jgi:Ca2+:H+ antiporter